MQVTMTKHFPPLQADMEHYISRMANGDTQAVAELYAAAKTQVFGFALSILKNASDAEDVLQDTFVSAFTHAGSYRPHGKPMAWLLTIAKNAATTKLRQGAKLKLLPEEQWAAIEANNPAVTPEDRMILTAAMNCLDDQSRQVLTLYSVAGLKHREIGEILDMPLATVLSKYHRAKKKLLSVLEEGELA